MSETHLKKTSLLTSIFLDFRAPTWSNFRKVIAKIEFFSTILGHLGTTWPNLGQKDAPRRPKSAKMKPKGVPREATWGHGATQESWNDPQSAPNVPQIDPKATQTDPNVTPTSLQSGPKYPKVVPKCTKVTPQWPNVNITYVKQFQTYPKLPQHLINHSN